MRTAPSPHPPGPQVLFYTDPGSRRLYKDHVRTVSQHWGAGEVWGAHHAEVQGEEAWQGGRRWAHARVALWRVVASSSSHPPPSPLVVPCMQVLERRNTVSGKVYRDDPAIMVRPS